MKLKRAIASLAVSGAAIGAAHAEQVVRIALSGPLSGPQAASGKDDENGLRLAIETLNRKPIIVGGKPVRFQMMSEDDQADPKTGVQVAQRLLDRRPVAFFGPQNSGVAIPVSRLTSGARIPMLTVASNPQLTTLGYDHIFRTGASDSVLGASMAVFAVEKLQARTAAVIDDRTAYGQGLADEFIAKAKSLGLQVVGREYTHSQANDFLGILATIKAKNPDVIFFGGYTPQAAPMAKQMVQRGVRAKLLGGGIFQSELAWREQLPKCPTCGELLLPGFVLEGEEVRHIARALDWVTEARGLLVVGTELQMTPVRELYEVARRRNVPIAWVRDHAEDWVPYLLGQEGGSDSLFCPGEV